MSSGARQWADLPLRTKGLAVVAIPLVGLLVTVALFAGFRRDHREVGNRIDHAFLVRRQLQTVLAELVDAESGVHAYVLTKRLDFLEPLVTAKRNAPEELAALRTLVRDNPPQGPRAVRLWALVHDRLARLDAVVETGTESVARVVASKQSMDAVRRQIAAMDSVEARQLAAGEDGDHAGDRRLNLIMVLVTGLSLAGGLLAALRFTTGVARRVERLATNAERLEAEAPLDPMPGGDDEVGRLGRTLERSSVLLAERTGGLRRTQEFLDRLITAGPVVVVRLMRPDYAVAYVSANIERVFGYKPADMIAEPQFLTDRVHPDDLDALTASFEAAVAQGAGRHEFRLRHHSGDHHWVEAEVTTEYGETGLPIALLAYLTDVDERRRWGHEVGAARDQALEASRLKSEFLANMSHEIRTPLNGVIGMTGLLLETELTDEQRDYATTAQASGDALLAVINDILDFSKIEAGMMELEVIDFDLRAAVEEAAQMLAGPAHAKGLELATLIHPDTPLDVRGDPGRLRQVLVNLLSNAVKFTDQGEIVVRVGLDPDPVGTRRVRFEVADTGIGLGPDEHGRLFQSFSQADASTTRRYGGTGLGLAISKQLVELMGGHIGVDSEPGHGARFWFTAVLGAASAPLRRFKVDGRRVEGQRVLAVDDNETNRAILSQTLRGWDVEATVVSSGREALGALRQATAAGRPFVVAILDHQMPEMDGLDLAAAIRREPDIDDVRLLLLTSSGRWVHAVSVADAGIDALLTKPIRQASLYDALLTMLGMADDPKPLVTATTLSEVRSQSRPRLLVVEDNAVNQKVATRMVERLGYRADVAATGREAIDAVARVPYAAVLMDCQMPVMDGYEATAEIRLAERAGTRIPIIAMTAGAMQGDEERALAAGMDGYVTKPVSLGALGAALQRWAPVDGAGAPTAPLDPAVLAGLRALEDHGGAGALDELVSLFLDDAATRSEIIHVAMAAGDLGAVGAAAHSLRGSSANLAAAGLAAICAEVEAHASAGDLASTAASVGALGAELARVRVALHEAFGGTEEARP